MSAHIACRPWSYGDDEQAGCFVVCPDHGLRQSFGSNHAVAHAACVEHNRLHHPVAPKQQILSLIYESVAVPSTHPVDLADLLRQAQANNRAFGVTGMLLAENGWFLQALEGPELIVEALLQAIRDDPRHRHLRVLSRELRSDRRFPDWSMAEGHLSELETRPLAEYYEALLTARGHELEAASVRGEVVPEVLALRDGSPGRSDDSGAEAADQVA